MTATRRPRLAPTSDGPSARWRPNVPLLSAGGVAVVAGGVAAAVTGPTDWDHGSWVAAFLVLVAGVAQIGLAVAQAQLAGTAPTVTYEGVQCGLWNSSCLAIVAGTLLSAPVAVTIGSGLMFAALVMSALVVRGRPGCSLLLWSYRVLLVVLLVSIPVGTALAWTRR